MQKHEKIFIVGDQNLSGIALLQAFKQQDFVRVFSEGTASLDILDQVAVSAFFKQETPDYVFFTHIKSGGIAANIKYPAEFMYANLQAQNNVIHAAYQSSVKKLLFFGSSCAYPRECPQPIQEAYLLTGPVEATSEPYALAKIAGIKLCHAYNTQYGTKNVCIIPATIYGPHDHFDPENSHVMSALIRKFHEAKMHSAPEVVVWGSGQPRREFIYIDDLVAACVFLMEQDDAPNLVNVGYGSDISIRELAQLIKEIVGFHGEIRFDASKPDGAFQKLLDSRKIQQLGWRPTISLQEGIARTYQWYVSNVR